MVPQWPVTIGRLHRLGAGAGVVLSAVTALWASTLTGTDYVVPVRQPGGFETLRGLTDHRPGGVAALVLALVATASWLVLIFLPRRRPPWYTAAGLAGVVLATAFVMDVVTSASTAWKTY